MPKSVKQLQKETEEMRRGVEEIHAVRKAYGDPLPKPRKGIYATKAMKAAHPQSPHIPAQPYGTEVRKRPTGGPVGTGIGELIGKKATKGAKTHRKRLEEAKHYE